MSGFSTLSNNLRARWERFTERERLLIGGMAMVVVVLVLAISGFVMGQGLSSLEDENAEMRQVLKDLEANKGDYQKWKSKLAQVEVKLGHSGFQLQGYLESAATQSDVTINETNERQPVNVGKKYVERAVDLHIQKVTLEQLAKFLRRIETGPNLVVVTSLSVRTRDDKHEDLGVEMTVSTWEKAPEAKPGHKKEGPAGAGGAKEGKGA